MCMVSVVAAAVPTVRACSVRGAMSGYPAANRDHYCDILLMLYSSSGCCAVGGWPVA